MLASIQTSIKPPQEDWEQPAGHKLRNFLGEGGEEVATGIVCDLRGLISWGTRHSSAGLQETIQVQGKHSEPTKQ